MTKTAHTNVDTPSFQFAKFLPGLVLGVVIGSLAGAFFPPVVQAWASLPPDPISHGPRPEANAGLAANANNPGQATDAEPVTVGTVTEGR